MEKGIDKILEKVKQIVSKQFNIKQEEVDSHTIVSNYGADSLDAVELMMACEKEFGISIPDEVFAAFSDKSTIESIAKVIKEVMDKKILIHFTTYSGDDYYMVTSDPYIKKLFAKEFCERFLPEEYAYWGEKFKYGRFKTHKINDNGSCYIPYVPCIGSSMTIPLREQDVIDTSKMENDKLYSYDELCAIKGFLAFGEPY